MIRKNKLTQNKSLTHDNSYKYNKLENIQLNKKKTYHIEEPCFSKVNTIQHKKFKTKNSEVLTCNIIENNKIEVQFGKVKSLALIDTGATISCISLDLYNKLSQCKNATYLPKKQIHPKTCSLANGAQVNITEIVTIPITIAYNTMLIKLHILKMSHLQIILGCDTLRRINANIDFANKILKFQKNSPANYHYNIIHTLGNLQEGKHTTNNSKNKTDEHIYTQSQQLCKPLMRNTFIDKIDFENADLNDSQKSQLITLIKQYRTIFADDIKELGTTHLMKYDIKLKPNTRPIRLRPYKTAWKEREIITEQIKEWLEAGIIVPSQSEWAAPCLLTKKKNSSKFRLCIDYRALNKQTELQSYPMMDMDLFLADLGSQKCKYFTVLDLRSAFLQMKLTPRTQDITTFICHEGAFKFLRCPFGLSNIPLAFCRLMDIVFKDIKNKFVHYFLDDIIITSKTHDEHMRHISIVFERLRRANLTIEPKKAFFFRKRVTFLGHKIDKTGISTDDDNIEKVKNFRPPSKKKDIRSFLGLCNYYRRFIKDFATIARPLQALVHKDTKFEWNEKQIKAFNELKHRLTTAPVLSLPDLNSEEPLILTTDASSLSVGFILSQRLYDDVTQRKEEKVICYGGRSLTEVQSRYTITELELFACLHAITKLDCYLRGRKFILITDHAPLKWLFNKDLSNVRPKLARWIVELQMYTFECRHTAGKNIPHVDFLSRQPYDNAEQEVHFKNDPYLNAVQTKPFNTEMQDRMLYKDGTELNIESIKKAQKQDFWYKMMYNYLAYNIVPKNQQNRSKILRLCNDFMINDNALYHIWNPTDKRLEPVSQLCIPPKYTYEIIKAHHDQPDFGHFGHLKTLNKIKEKFFWEGMYSDINHYIKACKTCAEANQGRTNKAPLKSLPISELPFQVVHIDILSLNTPSAGYKYIVLIIDSFSKYCISRPLRRKTSKAVSKTLFEELFLRYGFPEKLIVKADNGQENVSGYSKSLHELLKIERIFTTPYSPSSNGQVEIYNKTLLSLLRKFCRDKPSNWRATYCINSSVSESSKFSPLMLLHGIRTRSALGSATP